MANNLQRICCVCRVMQPVSQMTRVVRVGDEFMVQGTKRLNGRGAHVCAACLHKPELRKGLNRSFKTNLPENIFQQLSK